MKNGFSVINLKKIVLNNFNEQSLTRLDRLRLSGVNIIDNLELEEDPFVYCVKNNKIISLAFLLKHYYSEESCERALVFCVNESPLEKIIKSKITDSFDFDSFYNFYFRKSKTLIKKLYTF